MNKHTHTHSLDRPFRVHKRNGEYILTEIAREIFVSVIVIVSSPPPTKWKVHMRTELRRANAKRNEWIRLRDLTDASMKWTVVERRKMRAMTAGWLLRNRVEKCNESQWIAALSFKMNFELNYRPATVRSCDQTKFLSNMDVRIRFLWFSFLVLHESILWICRKSGAQHIYAYRLKLTRGSRRSGCYPFSLSRTANSNLFNFYGFAIMHALGMQSSACMHGWATVHVQGKQFNLAQPPIQFVYIK